MREVSSNYSKAIIGKVRFLLAAETVIQVFGEEVLQY